jgi:hypothetical protein
MGAKEFRGSVQTLREERRGGRRKPVLFRQRANAFPTYLAEVQGANYLASLHVIGDVIAKTAATRTHHGVMFRIEVGEGLRWSARLGISLLLVFHGGPNEFLDAHVHTSSIASVGQ